ncbi:hypothetical protein [Pseudomonas yamanorum]
MVENGWTIERIEAEAQKYQSELGGSKTEEVDWMFRNNVDDSALLLGQRT